MCFTEKIEMLFLDPNYICQGLGFQLVDFAVKALKTIKSLIKLNS